MIFKCHSLMLRALIGLLCLAASYTQATEIETLRCGDVPRISLDGNRYLSTGSGKTLSEAIEQAQQQLSQMLNTRVSSACSDREYSGAGVSVAKPEQANHQHCSLKSYSSNRFAHTPVLAVKHCDASVLAMIALDQRPLRQRMISTFAQLELDQDKQKVSGKLPFPALIRLLRNGMISLAFDEQQRLWRFQSQNAHLFVAQDELWHGVHWEGCSGDAEFRLQNWGEAIRSSRQGESIELELKTSMPFKTASLFEANEYGGLEVLADRLLPSQSNPFHNRQLIGNVIEGEQVSAYVYLLLLSQHVSQHYPNDRSLNPGVALSALLGYLLKQQDAALCAWPMEVTR